MTFSLARNWISNFIRLNSLCDAHGHYDYIMLMLGIIINYIFIYLKLLRLRFWR